MGQVLQPCVPDPDLYWPSGQLQQVVAAPAPSQSYIPDAHAVCGVAKRARHRKSMHQRARGAPRLMPGVSNISDCVFIESIGISPDTEVVYGASASWSLRARATNSFFWVFCHARERLRASAQAGK